MVIPNLKIPEIMYWVARELGMDPADIGLGGYHRDDAMVTARQIVILVAYHHSIATFQQLGKALGTSLSAAAKARGTGIARLADPEFCKLLVGVFRSLRVPKESTFGTLPLAMWPEGGRKVYLEAWAKAGPATD